MARSDLVLGIDAAWTAHNPSGVALIQHGTNGWALLAAASSHAGYHSACGRSDVIAQDSAGDVIASTKLFCGKRPDVVAVDMPLAHSAIRGRRVSDNRISSVYGSRGASTHSPSADRPGRIGEVLHSGFVTAGYTLATSAVAPDALIEVYPHPALIELCNAQRRLPYKCARAGRYWPDRAADERKEALIAEWRKITHHLANHIDGLDQLDWPDAKQPLTVLKAFEDLLDAVICAWVGTCYIEGSALPYGDMDSAIWVPAPRALQPVGEPT